LARGENGLWLNLIEYFDRQISKLVLGQTLTADTGQNGGGSFSLGQVHNEVRLDILADDAERLSETINAQLIPLVVGLNFGDVEVMPTFTIPVEEPEDQVALMGIIEKAVKLGQPVGREWFARKFNIPLPEEGEETLVAAAGFADGLPDPANRSDDAPPARTARQRAGEEDDQNSGLDRMTKDAAPAFKGWLDKLAAMLEAADSLEEFRVMLTNAYPDMTKDEMTAALSPAFMSAFLQGMDDAKPGGRK
jgi:phage gp29-like protein